MNKTLTLLLLSDVFLLTGFGLIAPILAIFVKDSLIHGSIAAAGIGSAIYFIVKALVQIPFSRYIDSHDHRKKWLLMGTILIAIVPFIFIMARTVWHMYIAQFINGLGAGIAAATWLSLWSTHLDKHHESFEWSIYSALIGMGIGIAAFIGSLLAQNFGFKTTFTIMGILTVIGALVLFPLTEKYAKKIHPTHYHKHRKVEGRP